MKLASVLCLQLHFPIARNLLDRQSIVFFPLALIRILFKELFYVWYLVKWNEDEKLNVNTNWLVRQMQTGYC